MKFLFSVFYNGVPTANDNIKNTPSLTCYKVSSKMTKDIDENVL